MRSNALFVTVVGSQESWLQMKILEACMRMFGDEMSQSRFLIFNADGENAPVKFMSAENIEIQALTVPVEIRQYIFATKVAAMAQAEKIALGDYKTITWIDQDCLILNPPLLYILNDDMDAAFRPVHIQNVGLRSEDPLDEYWRRIYLACGMKDIEARVDSFVDGVHLRAYFNTHAFSVDPNKGLMSVWLEIFTKLVTDQGFQASCCTDRRHQVFLFQAILSALIIREVKLDRIRILPPVYNYPYNLQTTIPMEKRVRSIDNLVTLTYEGKPIDPEKVKDIEIPAPYYDFLKRMSL